MMNGRRVLLPAAWLLAMALVAAGCGDLLAAQEPQVRAADFGTERDGDPAAQIHLAPAWAFWGGNDWKTFVRYENAEGFWWATTPPDPGRCIRARVLKSFYAGELRVRPLDRAPARAFFAVRYKDNLVRPAPVEFAAAEGFRRLGTLGGALDRTWKTAVFEVPGKDLAVADGFYHFRIGRQDFGDLMGDLPLQWARISDAPIAAPPDEPGYYPKRPATRFDDLGKTQVYRAGERPMFPVGVCIKGFRTNTFRFIREGGLSATMLLGWEEPLGVGENVFSSGRWKDRVKMGLPNQLDRAREAGMFYLPSFFTDTRSWWIVSQYRSEQNVVRAIERAIRENRNHPSLLAWWLKDEADHDDPTWGAPEEFIQELYNAQKRADPERPAFVNFQGWKPHQYERYLDAADIVGFDVYPLGRGESGRPIAEFTDRIRTEVAGRRAIWAILEGHEGAHVKKLGRMLTEREVVAEGYLALVHGIQGIFYYVDNEAEYIDLSEIPGPWAGMKQMAREVLDPKDGLLPYLVPPGKAVELAGVGKLVAPGSPSLHAALFEGPDGARVLVVVNEGDGEVPAAEIRVTSLAAGRKLPVLFEGREVTTEDGLLRDRFAGFDRHVYRLGP